MSTCVIEENNKGQIYAVIIWDSIIHLPSLLIFHLPLYSIAMHQHFYGVVLISRRDLTGNLRTVRGYGLSIDRLASLYWKTPRLHTTPLRQKSLFHAAAVKALCLALPMCRDMGVTLALVVWIKSTSEKYSLDFKNCSFKLFSYCLNHSNINNIFSIIKIRYLSGRNISKTRYISKFEAKMDKSEYH